MKSIFDNLSYEASRLVTKRYSTSFYAGVRCLDRKIQDDVHAIYGLVRFADEIVDTFHESDKAQLLIEFKKDTFDAIERRISLNPILNSFQHTVNKYNIDLQLVEHFFNSMEMDLGSIEYDQKKYEEYILGSAEVVGLMCLKIFVFGDNEEYERLKPYAMKLGSAFQKINFLRDLKSDYHELGRTYFPGLDLEDITPEDKKNIEKEIDQDFSDAFIGIKQLPKSSRFGVYVSYTYYSTLLRKIKGKTIQDLLSERIRVSNNRKALLFAKSYIKNSMNFL